MIHINPEALLVRTSTDQAAWLLVGNLQHLQALEANGLHCLASRLVDKIAVGLSRAPPRAEPSITDVQLPAGERGRTEHDLRELDRLNARLAREYRPHRGQTAEQQREADLDRRQELESRAETKRAERERDAGIAETTSLAAGRGEAVGEDRAGVKRILDHDPLFSLRRAGVLTNEQLEAGEAVRELYDLRQGDAASVAFDGMPAGRHDHERFVANRFTRAKTTVPVSQLETALLNGHFRTRDGYLHVVRCWPALKAAGMETHIALHVLRWVCCEHNTLTSMGRGRAYDRNRKALCWALDVADEVLDGRMAMAPKMVGSAA